MEINREIKNITSAFVLEDNLTECVPYGSGHINDTYRLTYDTGKHYILQKMNRSIFTKPVELMENVSGVTAWLKKKIQENGGDVERETLNLVMTKDGLPYYVDEDGEYWRVYLFIEGATCYDAVKDDNDFYQSAVAFGHFQRLLADYHLEARFSETKEWYDGYRFGNVDVYCPWDVINHIDRVKDDPNARPEAYWINTSGNILVKNFITRANKTTLLEELKKFYNKDS